MNQFLLWRISVLRVQRWLGIKCELVPSVSTLQTCSSQLVHSNGWCPPTVPQSQKHHWLEWRQNVMLMHLLLLLLFSHAVVSDSLWPHELQHTRPPCPSTPPRVHPNPCPLSRWCHPTISSSVVPFSSRPQTFLASGYFPMSQLFPSGGQSIGVSVSTSVLPMNTQDWSPLGWTCWISLQS